MRTVRLSLALDTTFYEQEDGPFEYEDGTYWTDGDLMEHYKERYAEILLDFFNEMNMKGDISLMADLIEGELTNDNGYEE